MNDISHGQKTTWQQAGSFLFMSNFKIINYPLQ